VLQTRDVVTLTTGSGGGGLFIFEPGFNANQWREHTNANIAAIATFTAPVNAGPSALASMVTANANTTGRVVSSSVRWWDIAPATAQGGVVVASNVPNINDWYNKYDTTTFNGTSTVLGTEVAILDRREPAEWHSVPNSHEEFEFNTLHATTGNGEFVQRSSLILHYTGAASSDVLQVEIVTNYEITIDPGHFFARSMSKGRTHNPAMAAAVDHVHSIMPAIWTGTKDHVRERFKSLVKDALKTLVKGGLAVASNYFIPGSAGATYAIADSIDVD